MSFDRQIDQVCTHLVVEELLFVDDDHTTVTPKRPISAFDSVAVRMNGTIEVPSSGVNVPAQAGGVREGPFVITSSSNTFSVSVNGQAVQTATLPLSAQMPAQQVADLLNPQLRGVSFYADRKFLRFRSELTGDDATVYVMPGSTLAPVVGIRANLEYRGKLAVPGWTLINDPNTLLDRPTRLIVFDQPLRGFNDFVEVNYTTVRQECRRCGGVGIENDWRYGTDGNVAEVRDEALLIQELQKATYTPRGSNPFHPWYGSSLLERIGQKSNSALFQSTVVSDVQQTFARWQSIKSQQEKGGLQPVSDEEFPFRLVSAAVEQSSKDPTVFFVNVTVQNRSLKEIQLTRGLKLPLPLNLLDETVAQGVIRQSLKDFTTVE